MAMDPCAVLALIGLIEPDAQQCAFSVKEATYAAAAHEGHPTIGDELHRLALRESRGSADVGVHQIDSWASHRVWKRAVAKGWLDPECQPDGDGWSTRGPHGLMAAYSLRFLTEVPCADPALLDHPGVSAVVAARRWLEAGDACEDRVAAWAGWGRWLHRWPWRRWSKTWEVCREVHSEVRAILAWFGKIVVSRAHAYTAILRNLRFFTGRGLMRHP